MLRTRTALRAETRKFLNIDDVVQYAFAIATQGSHTTPSSVTIQALTPEGKPLNKATRLKVRVTNAFQGVTATNVGTAGSGYLAAPLVVFSGGGGSGAAGTAVLSGSGVASITITNPGTGYTSAPTITFVPVNGGTLAAATCTVTSTLANATNATIAAGSGTLLVDTVTATKDLVFQSDATGLFTLTCTDATVESFSLAIGPHMGVPVGDFTPMLTVTHG